MRYFSVEWSDLKEETQESILESTLETLRELAQEEGEQILKRDWHEPKPKTWQEAYCREYAIEWEWWTDYEHQTEDAEIPTESQWDDWVTDHLTEIAEKECYKSMHHLEIEVDV